LKRRSCWARETNKKEVKKAKEKEISRLMEKKMLKNRNYENDLVRKYNRTHL